PGDPRGARPIDGHARKGSLGGLRRRVESLDSAGERKVHGWLPGRAKLLRREPQHRMNRFLLGGGGSDAPAPWSVPTALPGWGAEPDAEDAAASPVGVS